MTARALRSALYGRTRQLSRRGTCRIRWSSRSLTSTVTSVSLLTPSFAPDLDRLRLQRWALERTGTIWQHLVVVHTEDLELFRSEIEPHPCLEIAPTSAFLTRAEEAARRHPRLPVSLRPKRVGLAGWLAQQIVKMRAIRASSSNAVVCLD